MGQRSQAGDKLSWLFIGTLPNSGSTALAQLMGSADSAVMLHPTGEGQWLVPELSNVSGRWNADLPVDYDMVRAVWIDAALRAARRKNLEKCVVIEKSPPNIARFGKLLDAFEDMPTTVILLARDPYAICASWAKRYGNSQNAHVKAVMEMDGAKEDGSDADYFRRLGESCGRRFMLLSGLRKRAALTVTYEALTTDPALTAAQLCRAVPLLEGLDPAQHLNVKDYGPQGLENMNKVQLDRLTPAKIQAIGEGLAPYAGALEAFGYTIK